MGFPYKMAMGRILNSLLVLSMLGAAIQGAKVEKEINLNFQQNDYQIKFERVELVRYNKDLMEEFSIVTYKYNRTTPVANMTFMFKIDLGNEWPTINQAYKFMSNEYRPFPIHFAANTCKAINADVGGVKSGFMKCGNFAGCPIVKGKRYHVCNFSPDQSKLPPFIPNGQYKMEMQLLHSSTEMAVVDTYATIFRPLV